MSVQDLAQSLAAAGSVRLPDDEGGIYLLHVNGGNLAEKLWVGDGAKYNTPIASDARNDTSASYLLSVVGEGDDAYTQRLVLFIDQSNTIQCYSYNEEVEEWEKTGLGEKLNITTSPTSKLSANYGPNHEVVISYQDTAGRLAGIMNGSQGEWEKFGPFEAEPIAGTPQRLEVFDNKLHLFYVGKETSVHYLVLDSNTGKWQVNVLENSKFDTPIDTFSVAKNPDDGSLQSYFLTNGYLWNVQKDKKTRLGKVEDNGKFIPSDKAQAGWRIRWSGARKVVAQGNRLTIWY